LHARSPISQREGLQVLVQDYDIPMGASFVDAMHEAIINSRDLIILFTEDYLRSPYTRKEFTSFEADRVKTAEERHIIVLRCEDVPLRGLLADNVYQSLVGVEASVASSPLLSASRRQGHRHRDRSSVCRRVSQASQAALNNWTSSTPS
jgi:TIR domain